MFKKNLKLSFATFALFIISASASAGQLDKLTEMQQFELMVRMMHQSEKAGSFQKMGSQASRGEFKKVAFAPRTRSFGKKLAVTATAYTSHVGQTDSTPNIAAWGDRLRPGMKAIAVSRDLLNVYGLKHKQKVRIKGLKGEYVVLDKMNKRWRKKIDIYMGMNKRKAFQWGRRKVEIQWN